MYAFAWAASVKAACAPVGIPYLAHKSFMNDLEPSRRAAAALGPNTLRGSPGFSGGKLK